MKKVHGPSDWEIQINKELQRKSRAELYNYPILYLAACLATPFYLHFPMLSSVLGFIFVSISIVKIFIGRDLRYLTKEKFRLWRNLTYPGVIINGILWSFMASLSIYQFEFHCNLA